MPCQTFGHAQKSDFRCHGVRVPHKQSSYMGYTEQESCTLLEWWWSVSSLKHLQARGSRTPLCIVQSVS